MKAFTVPVLAAWMALALPSMTGAAPAETFMRLEDLERMALASNPTIAQAEAIVRSVLGRADQARRYPNPVVGYEASDITAREPGRGKHFLWIQQPIVTGGKRAHVQAAVAQERVHAETEQVMQQQRVLNAVRALYYETLGAWRTVEIRRELARLTREAVDVSDELFNVGQADRPDVLEVEVEAQRAEIELARAEHDLARVWQELAAVVGDPDLPLTPLAGDLEAAVPAVDEDAVRKAILADSPELKIARARVEHARASAARARAERVPNFFVRVGGGHNFERVGPGKDVGAEFFVEVGVPLPIFDRNQGGIAQAEAQLRLAEGEVRRVELELRQRLAGALRAHRDAQAAVQRYRDGMLARAQQAHRLYLERFREMAAAYPQVLIAQRNLVEVRADYVRTMVEAWQSAVLLRGFLLTGGLEAPADVPGEPAVTVETLPVSVTP